MENRSLPIGFIIKQVNNVYEKDLNERLKKNRNHIIPVRGARLFVSYE